MADLNPYLALRGQMARKRGLTSREAVEARTMEAVG